MNEDLTEPRVEEEVDDEVDGRVGDDQQVAETAKVELESFAVPRTVVKDRPHESVGKRRRLTDDENDDDDDEDQGDVVVLALAGALHLGPLATQLLQRLHEADVEDRQHQQRQDQHEDHVEDVVVDEDVQLALAQLRLVSLDLRTVRRTLELEVALGETGDVVEYGEDEYHCQLDPCLTHGAEAGGLVGLADGDVTVDSDKYGHPDCGRLTDGGQRKDVDEDYVVTLVQIRCVETRVANKWFDTVERKYS